MCATDSLPLELAAELDEGFEYSAWAEEYPRGTFVQRNFRFIFSRLVEILRLPLRILITKTMQENDLGDQNKDQNSVKGQISKSHSSICCQRSHFSALDGPNS